MVEAVLNGEAQAQVANAPAFARAGITSVTLRNVGTDGDFAARQATRLPGPGHSDPANYPDLVRDSDSTTMRGGAASSQRSQ
ncbi:hypothetical protein GCM10027405_01480 [Arthrobacter alkaliphilus]